MKLFTKILFVSIAIVLAIWVLPWLYSLAFVNNSRHPFTLYSTVVNDFAMVDFDGNKAKYADLSGKSYTESQFDSILPLFYYRQLISDDCFPDSLKGIAITPKMVQTESFFFRSFPQTVNEVSIPLYQLMESMPTRVDLEMPTDVFRMGKTIEFVDMESNCVNAKKSAMYNDALSSHGFVFPAKIVAGNPTTKKEYDEGYIMVDSNNELFHVKQVVGRPFVRHIEKPAQFTADHIYITEFSNKRSLAFIVDVEQRFWVLTSKTYEFMQVEIPSFDPRTMEMSIIANLFDWTISIEDDEAERIYAIDANSLKLIKQMEYPSKPSTAQRVKRFIPTLEFTKYHEYSVFPHLNWIN